MAASLDAMSVQLMTGPEPRVVPERRARILSGLPRPVDRSRPWLRRTVRNPWAWLILALVLTYPLGLWQMYTLQHPDQHIQGHVIPGLNNDALREATGLAARTAIVWTLLFVWLDRFRRQAFWMYLVAWGWGASIATLGAMYLNSWLGELMMVRGAGDPGAGARAAVFSAPFIEEACKATIVFALAVLVRHRVASILQSVTLAGLSATGFAFTENIVYYARARVYASYQRGAGDADAAVASLFRLRGIYTSFGHMLFTSMTGIGIGIAVRTRSKLVRVLAPLTGYVLAATLHMSFNGISSTSGSTSQLMPYYFLALGLVAAVVAFLVFQTYRESRRIRQRLTDFVRMGWLDERDPTVYSSWWRRIWILTVAARRGRASWSASRRFMIAITDLAYTRDAVVRGVVDAAGDTYERALLVELRGLRPLAITESAGLRLDIPWERARFWQRGRRGWLPPQSGGWAAPVPVPVQQWPAPPPQRR